MKAEKIGDIYYYTAAGGVLVNEPGSEVLVLIRPSRDEIRLPKGHVETGESIEKAALREVTEETGYINIEILEDLGVQLVAFQYDGCQVQRTEYYFLMRLTSPQQQPRPLTDENQFFTTWVSLDGAKDVLTFDAERTWLARAKKVLSSLQ